MAIETVNAELLGILSVALDQYKRLNSQATTGHEGIFEDFYS